MKALRNLAIFFVMGISTSAMADSYRCTYYWWAQGSGNGYHEYVYTNAFSIGEANDWFANYLAAKTTNPSVYIKNYGCILGKPYSH